MNWVLVLFDIFILPLTLIRLFIIYFNGSKYDIKGFKFLDIMMHSDNKYFNHDKTELSINTIKKDIRQEINECSRLFPENNYDSDSDQSFIEFYLQ